MAIATGTGAKASGGGKVCVACGEDCTNKPRTKDAKGRYFCKPCYDGAVAKLRSLQDQVRIPDDGLNIPLEAPPDSARMLDSLLPLSPEAFKVACPGCGRSMSDSEVICVKCGYSMQTGHAIGAPRIARPKSAAPEGALKMLVWPVYLFVRPDIFYGHLVQNASPLLFGLFFWIFGMACAIDRMEFRATFPSNSTSSLQDTWPMFWAIAALGGILAGAVAVLIGGWWYGVRLRWSGEDDPDRDLVRRVYVFTAAVFAVPVVAYKLFDTFRFDTPSASSANLSVVDVLILICVFWSVVNSFVAVRTAFQTRLVPAVIWFLAVPMAFYAAIMVAAAVVGAMIGVAAATNPAAQVAVDQRQTFQGSFVAFQYPGNWQIDRSAPNDSSDREVTIQPEFQDAMLRIEKVTDADSVDQQLDFTVDDYVVSMEEAREAGVFATWGQLHGKGRILRGTMEGQEYTVRVFVSKLNGKGVLVVHEVCNVSHTRTVEPGFRLIQDTFSAR